MFDVYVDGATGTSREAVRELAGAMAARYRLPAAELEARLTRGRFRVKAGVDRATAEAYLRDLAAIGARVRIEPAGAPAGQPSPPEPQATRASPPQQRSPLPPPPAESRAMRSSRPPPSESRPAPPPAESRAMRSSRPPPSESRPAPPPAPPAAESRAMRSSLPPQTESRAMRSSLPPQTEARPARSSLPPQTEARPARSSLPPSTAAPLPPASSGAPGGGGVVAATGPIATLGALDRSGALALATLDDEPAQAPSTDGVLPASMGPAAPRPARPARSRSEPVDPFAPPELAAVEPLLQLALADDDVAHRARKQASAPSAMAGEPGRHAAPSNPPPGPQRASPAMAPGGPPQATPSSALAAEAGHRTPPGPSAGVPPGPVPMPSVPVPPAGPPWSLDAAAPAITAALRRLGGELVARIPVLASARVRLVAGVALAIALGFVPAHLVGGMRERSAFAAIDAGVVAVQSTADTPDSYAALDAFRAEQLEAKYGARRSIVVTALLVWAVVGAALAFGWFALFRSASATPITASPGTREVRAADK